jgi:hypothetical protein
MAIDDDYHKAETDNEDIDNKQYREKNNNK